MMINRIPEWLKAVPSISIIKKENGEDKKALSQTWLQSSNICAFAIVVLSGVQVKMLIKHSLLFIDRFCKLELGAAWYLMCINVKLCTSILNISMVLQLRMVANRSWACFPSKTKSSL